jgi:hypothetical protein
MEPTYLNFYHPKTDHFFAQTPITVLESNYSSNLKMIVGNSALIAGLYTPTPDGDMLEHPSASSHSFPRDVIYHTPRLPVSVPVYRSLYLKRNI